MRERECVCERVCVRERHREKEACTRKTAHPLIQQAHVNEHLEKSIRMAGKRLAGILQQFSTFARPESHFFRHENCLWKVLVHVNIYTLFRGEE